MKGEKKKNSMEQRENTGSSSECCASLGAHTGYLTTFFTILLYLTDTSGSAPLSNPCPVDSQRLRHKGQADPHNGLEHRLTDSLTRTHWIITSCFCPLWLGRQLAFPLNIINIAVALWSLAEDWWGGGRE